MVEEAAKELETLEADDRAQPAVLAYQVILYGMAQKWSAMQQAAAWLVRLMPQEPGWWIQWAYATRRAASIPEANAILLEAEALHPREPTIQFNLGCYAAQMGNHSIAQERVNKAIELDSQFKTLALTDPDLKELRKFF